MEEDILRREQVKRKWRCDKYGGVDTWPRRRKKVGVEVEVEVEGRREGGDCSRGGKGVGGVELEVEGR